MRRIWTCQATLCLSVSVTSAVDVHAVEVAILCLKLLTDRLRRIHVREIFDVVTSVSSQEHIKDLLGFNYPFFWEEEEKRDRKDINPQQQEEIWRGGV